MKNVKNFSEMSEYKFLKDKEIRRKCVKLEKQITNSSEKCMVKSGRKREKGRLWRVTEWVKK